MARGRMILERGNNFRMKRLLKFFSMLLFMLLAAGLGLYVALQYGLLILEVYAFLIFMAIITPWFLTDLLVTWTELFSIIIGSFILSVGISYIPLYDRLALILVLPIVLITANQVEALFLEKKVRLQFKPLRPKAIMNTMLVRHSILRTSLFKQCWLVGLMLNNLSKFSLKSIMLVLNALIVPFLNPNMTVTVFFI